MNKQKVIEKLEYLKRLLEEKEGKENYDHGFINALIYTLTIVKQLDEPDKLDEPEIPVITKDEAKWINDLKSFYNLPDVLYHITRCGYDGNGFTFTYWSSVYELPIEDGIDCSEVDAIRKRLVNAVIYGYKINEEKLYQVELPGSHTQGDIILIKNDDGDITYSLVFSDRWKERDYTKLTEDEIKKDHEWAWQFAEEVKE